MNNILSLLCDDLKLLSLLTIVNSFTSVIVGITMVAVVVCHFTRQKAVAGAEKVKSFTKVDLTYQAWSLWINTSEVSHRAYFPPVWKRRRPQWT